MLQHSRAVDAFDVLGVGFGPSNLALAIALRERNSRMQAHFIERAPRSGWHPHMLLDGSDIQNNPLRDLVTPRNPQSYYSFTNYLKCENRLFDYLNLGTVYPLRKEYARYIEWVASRFADQASYGSPALSISLCPDRREWCVETPAGVLRAAALVMGVGRGRNIPRPFESVMGDRVVHLSDYLRLVNEPGRKLESVAVVGASQSAVEIHLDLLARFPMLQIHGMHRSYSMRQKDTSPFSDHVYFPEFVDYYFNLDKSGRNNLQRQLRGTNYSAADIDVLHKLYVTLYEERLDGRNRFTLHNNTEITAVRQEGEKIVIEFREQHLGRAGIVVVDAVILATGFKDIGTGEGKEQAPELLRAVADQLERDDEGALVVNRDYSVRVNGEARCYLNGLCESSHGLGDAGSFSLLALRSAHIAESLERGHVEQWTHRAVAFGDRRLPNVPAIMSANGA